MSGRQTPGARVPRMPSNYERGVSDGKSACVPLIDKLAARLKEVERDRDEWKQQHENLLAVRQQDIAALTSRAPAQQTERMQPSKEAAPLDCRTPSGVTVGLIDGIIAMARVLRSRDQSAPDVIEALKDIRQDEDVAALLAQQGAAQAGAVDLDKLQRYDIDEEWQYRSIYPRKWGEYVKLEDVRTAIAASQPQKGSEE